ncbi:MAG: hypothetical protein H6738_21505 [Alphaproteobacteria bacterium]|nr:hypothetical protein [Alphaproteobacteria bacterium]
MRAVAILCVLGACGGDVEPRSEWEPNALRPPEIEPEEELTGARLDASGPLKTEEASEKQELRIDTSTGLVSLTIDTPTAPDLTAWDDADVLVSLREGPTAIGMSITQDGDLLYLLEPDGPGTVSDELLGPNLLATDTDLGTVASSAWQGSLWSALIRTDTGDVELFPGQPAEVIIRGDTFRAILIASYDMESVTAGCSMDQTRMAYELLRVEPGSVDTTRLVRAETDDLGGAVCVPSAQ